nr:lactate racemase domain-containing protein [uncultured Oscillibacter sp.]
MVQIKEKFDGTCIPVEQIPDTVFQQLGQKKLEGMIKPGMRIAITVGSRGVSNIPLITRSIADFVKSQGGRPFVVPSMGSHGGATAEGQRALIEGYGVTEEAIGCPILSSMETVEVGHTEEGQPVRMDKNAYEADGIIVCGRVKPHTGFRGPYESGLMKMMAIGLGKQAGAEIIHQDGFGHFEKNIPMFGTVILRNSKVICGLALVENAYDCTREIIGLTPDEIITEEPVILLRAKSYMPRILFDKCDVLIVDEIGKNISGDGMDPNISGRFPTPYATGGIDAQRVVVLDLTKESHGNACGIGLADVTCMRLFEKFDKEATYPNAITNTVTGELKIPMIMYNDKQAIQLGIKSCNEIDRARPRVIRIKNTMKIETIEISEALLEEASQNPNIEILTQPEEMKFNEQDNLW